MGNFKYLMSRGGQKGERFGSSFQTSGLPSPWSGNDLAGTNNSTKRAEQASPFTGIGSTPMELRLPLPQGLDTGFKTNSARRAVDGGRCVDDQPTYGVIGDEVHQNFLLHQARGSASQHIHTHGRLDVAEEQFHIPTLAVEISQVSGAIARRIRQGCHQVKLLERIPGTSMVTLIWRRFKCSGKACHSALL